VELRGRLVSLRPATAADVDALAAIRATPEVQARWSGDDVVEEIIESIEDPDLGYLAVVLDGDVVGAIQWSESADPMYRHAGIDIFLDPGVHGRGIGPDAVRTLCVHLVDDVGHHRLVIDPAADNEPAIRCYAKVGFRPVGVMRRYEQGPDGEWHDGLLMDLLADDLIR
jgi:aminoglycoside 6'-N-acetyltransferase